MATAEQLIQQYFGWDSLPTVDGSGWNGAYETYITPDQAQALFNYGRSNGARVGTTSVGYGGDGWSWDSGNPQYADSLLGQNGQLFKLSGGQGFSLTPVGGGGIVGLGDGGSSGTGSVDGPLRYQLTYAKGADGWNTAQGQMASHQDFMDRIAPYLPLLLAGGAMAIGGTGAGASSGADLFSGLGDTTADIVAGDSVGGAAGGADLFSGLGDTTADITAGSGYGPGATVYEPGVGPATDGASAFNAGNTLGEGGLPGTLSPNSYWNPVTETEMPYGEVGSTGSTSTPWYEKLFNGVANNPGAASTLGKALLSFATTPTQGGGAGGMSLPGGMGGSGSGGGSGASGTSSGSTITPQQLANPQFTKWDSPLGVQYKSINPLDNSSLAQALRSY